MQPASNRPGGHDTALLRRLCSVHALRSVVDVSTPSLPSAQPRLLLVEKDAAMSAVLTRMLASHYRVETAADGLAACHAAKGNPPDAVVVDLSVPDTDNLTLIRSLRADPRTALLPIIMLTASTHRELLLRCLTAGASNFLLKPFNTSELLTCVRLELELRAPLAEPQVASGASHDC